MLASPDSYSYGDFHLFAASLNACIVMLNLAGINQKKAMFAAVTLLIEKNGEQYSTTTDLSYVNQQNNKTNAVIIDLVSDQYLNILHLETQMSTGSEVIDVMAALDEPQVQKYVTQIVKTQLQINYVQ